MQIKREIERNILKNENNKKVINMVDKEVLEEIQNCIDDAVEQIRDGYSDIAESDLVDAAYLINTKIPEKLREQVAASLEINPLDWAQ